MIAQGLIMRARNEGSVQIYELGMANVLQSHYSDSLVSVVRRLQAGPKRSITSGDGHPSQRYYLPLFRNVTQPLYSRRFEACASVEPTDYSAANDGLPLLAQQRDQLLL